MVSKPTEMVVHDNRGQKDLPDKKNLVSAAPVAPTASGEGQGTEAGVMTSPDLETELPLQREGPPEVRKRVIFDNTPEMGGEA